MKSDEALGRLREMLHAAGIDRSAPNAADVGATWLVLREFAREPVEDADPPENDGDMFLAQYGTSAAWKDKPAAFTVDITRQFIFSPGGEYDHMSQLQCMFSFEPTPENRAVGSANMWGAADDSFFDRALQMPGFRLGGVPTRLDTGYGDV